MADKGLPHTMNSPNEKVSYDGKSDSETNVEVHEAGEHVNGLTFKRCATYGYGKQSYWKVTIPLSSIRN